MAMAYKWKPWAQVPVSAQVAGEEISRIRDEQGEFFTPGAVVAASKPKTAPLHPAFEWNNAAAAQAWREAQAKQIIRSIVVVDDAKPAEHATRAFVSINTHDGARYTTIEAALNDDDMRQQLLNQAIADLNAFERKYSSLVELAKVFSAAQMVRQNLRFVQQGQSVAA